jgi:hypothetical protein
MSAFQAKFDVLTLPQGRGTKLSVRLVSFSGAPEGSLRIEKRIAMLTVDEPGTTYLTVEPTRDGDGPRHPVQLSIGVSAGLESAFVASIESAVELDPATSLFASNPLLAQAEEALKDAYQSAVFDAIGKMHEQRPSAVTASLAMPELGTPQAAALIGAAATGTLASEPSGRRKWLTVKRSAVAVVVIGALAMIAHGVLKKSPSAVDASNPLPLSGAAGGDLAAQIDPVIAQRVRQQIEQSLSKPPRDGSGESGGIMPGRSVTLETMEAMGLQPGKANTGCLVGVRK